MKDASETIKLTKELVDVTVGDAIKGERVLSRIRSKSNPFFFLFSNASLLLSFTSYLVRNKSIASFDGLGPPDLCYLTKVRNRISRPVGNGTRINLIVTFISNFITNNFSNYSPSLFHFFIFFGLFKNITL